MDVNNASKSRQKQVSPNSRSGLQQSLRDAILGGSGAVGNGDVNNGHKDMVRIGNIQLLYRHLDSNNNYCPHLEG